MNPLALARPIAQCLIRICGVGLNTRQAAVLQSLCMLSEHSARTVRFELAPDNEADLYVLDAETDGSAETAARLTASHKPIVVLAPGGARSALSPHVVPKPVLPSRLLARLDLAAQGVVAPAAAAPGARSARAASVLVVDDSPTTRIQVEQVLRERAVSPTLAASGEEALQLVAQYQFDLVLLDVVLPNIDGYQVCRAIKRNGQEPPKVVMLTSRNSPFDRIRGSMAGCDDYLTKPVRLEDLQQTLDRYLGAPDGGALPLGAAPSHLTA
jgi:two-component system cell cycle response regulator